MKTNKKQKCNFRLPLVCYCGMVELGKDFPTFFEVIVEILKLGKLFQQ